MQRAWRRNWEKNKKYQQALVKKGLGPLVAVGFVFSMMTGAYANPSSGIITTGLGSISTNGQVMTVNQSTDKLAINWNTFSIDASETVNFIQPSSQSIALNRVIGSESSNIYGTLTANGKVFLINPNGVLFAPGASVNVGGLVASTTNISDQDFQRGTYGFVGGQGGSVINGGNITATAGNVELLGSVVSNQGIIAANGISTDGTSGVVRLVGSSVNLNVGSKINADTSAVLRAGADGKGAGTVTVAAGSVSAPQTTIYYNPTAYNDKTTKSDTISNPYSTLLPGTNVTAYMLVNTATDLQNINTNLWGTYALNNDLNLGGVSIAPLGNGSAFSGIFNGDKHTISNLAINSAANNVGLFGSTNKATISDLALKDVDIKGTSSSQYTYTGALVGLAAQSTIANVSVSGVVQGNNDYIGGVVGRSTQNSKITNAHNSAAVTALVAGNSRRHAAGIVGMNDNGSIVDQSINDGKITNTNNESYTGGLVAFNYNNGTIQNGMNNGAVTGAPGVTSYVGGLVGSSWGDSLSLGSTVEGSTNNGEVKGGTDSNIGGLVGGQENSSIISSENNGEVNGEGKWIGGLVGVNYGNSLIDSSINLGNVIGGKNVNIGGLVGYHVNSTITNSQNYGTVNDTYGCTTIVDGTVRMDSGYELYNATYLTNVKNKKVQEINKNIGGIVGKSVGGSIDNVVNNGYVAGNNTFSNIGGIVGWADNTSIKTSLNQGIIASQSYSNIGGIVGFGANGTELQSVTNTGFVGDLNTTKCLPMYYSNVGGIIGWNDGGIVQDAYHTGTVNGAYGRRIGGIAGYNSRQVIPVGKTNQVINPVISNSTNGGSVTGQADCSYVGGIVGFNEGGAIIQLRNTEAGIVANSGNSSYVGGIAGANDKGTITASVNAGIVTAKGNSSHAGGIAGMNKSSSAITTSVNQGIVTNNGVCSDVGGIAGANDNATILSSENTGSVISTANSSYAGGIAGTNKNTGKIIETANQGTVTNNGASTTWTGGIAGSNLYNSTIEKSYNTGTISALGYTTYIGGIAGWNGENLKTGIVNISNSYNTGDISGGKGCSDTGGLVGYNTGNIANSYSSSIVRSNNGIYTGALIGYSAISTGFTNLYFDTTLAGSLKAVGNLSSVKGITGLSHSAMSNANNFSGWDFNSTWQMNDVIGLPSLIL